MWRKRPHGPSDQAENQFNDFKALLRYINNLADHKLGYPVSLLTYLGIIDNKILGIKPGSLANVLINNVGDPFKDSETSLMEVKRHEREIILILEKYYGLEKNEARGYVTTGGTEGNFAGLWWSKRYLINQQLDKLIKRDDIIKLLDKEVQELSAGLVKIPLNAYQQRAVQLQKLLDAINSASSHKSIVQQLLTPTVFYSKGHTHYSIPKIAEILHLNIRPVETNEDGSIDLNKLKKEVLLNQGAHPHSAIIVIANIGTTITGAIDDVPGVKQVLDTMAKNTIYTIHLDGALTGFVLPILKPFGDVKNYFDAIGVNSLAVSAHKYPGLSQPCGIILARRVFFEKAFEKSERSIDYVGNIIDVTITGSRSGLNVLMFYNALCSLGLDKNTKKLTKMVADNLNMATYLYNELIKLYGEEKVSYPYHFNVMFPRPSAEMAKRYQLMLTGDRATICVLTNVSKSLVDRFIKDLKLEKERIMTTTKDYVIKTLTAEYLTSTVDLFVHAFCDSEPITKTLGMNYHEYQPFAKEVVQKAITDGLSKIAVDKQNKVIACCVAEDMVDRFLPKYTHYPKLKPVFSLLDTLSKPFLSDKTFNKGKIAHVWVAAVDPEYRGQKLSTEIDKATAELLARKGYDFVYAEFTNPLSEKIVNQYKLFQRINKINYSDFMINHENKPFAVVPGAAASYVIVIRPGIKLSTLENAYRVEEKY